MWARGGKMKTINLIDNIKNKTISFLRSSIAKHIFVILVVGAVFSFLWFYPKSQEVSSINDETRIKAENDTRRSWAQVVGVFGGIFLLYFWWRRVEIAEKGQITERFTRAIDQLGAIKEIEGRLEKRKSAWEQYMPLRVLPRTQICTTGRL